MTKAVKRKQRRKQRNIKKEIKDFKRVIRERRVEGFIFIGGKCHHELSLWDCHFEITKPLVLGKPLQTAEPIKLRLMSQALNACGVCYFAYAARHWYFRMK